MEKRMEVKTFTTKLYCDKCGTEMHRMENVFATYPPVYTYKCPNCGETSESVIKYPFMEYVEVGNDEA